MAKNWSDMSDQEKSDDLQRSLDHHAKHGTKIEGPLPSEKDGAAAMVHVVSTALAAALKSDARTKAAFVRLRGRGHSDATAFDLLGKGMFCCMQEDLRQMTDRWPAVMDALADGRTLEEMFPNGLYNRDGPAN